MANMASACALVVSEEKSFDPVRSWSTRTAATTCAFVTISVISICVMVVCGVFVVREYALAEGYKRNHCWVEDISYVDVKECTFCHGHKTKEKNSASCVQSKFPCVRVTAAYEVDEEKREGLLHSNSIEASGLFNQCSHQVCMKDYEASKKAVDQYVEKWKNLMARHLDHHDGNGSSLSSSSHDFTVRLLHYLFDVKMMAHNVSGNDSDNPLNSTKLHRLTLMKGRAKNTTHDDLDIANGYFRCFVNEEEPYDVIEHKTYTKSDVVHCMLWPALVVFVCCCAFLYIEASRRRLTFCGQKDRPQGQEKFPEGRSFLPSGKVKVLDRSHFAPRGLEEHGVKSSGNKSKDSEAYIKKTSKTYPAKSRIMRDNPETEDRPGHVTKNERGDRPNVDDRPSARRT